MKRTLLAGALLIAGASVTASAADLTLYGRQDFRDASCVRTTRS
jgi:hypothetical protein